MKEAKCGNCGEDCLDEHEHWENSVVVPIRYFIDKKQVCCDCYQILRELEHLGY
jgi:hypothetical protein